MEFTLESIDCNGTHRTVSFTNDYLPVIVAEFELFLKGAGFVFDELEVHHEPVDDIEYNDVASEAARKSVAERYLDHGLVPFEKQEERIKKEQEVQYLQKQKATDIDKLNHVLKQIFDDETAGPILHGNIHKR